MLLSQGSPLETVNGLSFAELKSLYITMKNGLWGYSKDYVIGYNNYLMQHNIGQTVIASVAGKKFKPVEPKQFHEIFGNAESLLTLGKGKESRAKREAPEVKALLSMHPPQWVIDRLMV